MDDLTLPEIFAAEEYVLWCDARGVSWKAQLARDFLSDSTEWGGEWNVVRGLRRFGTPSEFERFLGNLVQSRKS